LTSINECGCTGGIVSSPLAISPLSAMTHWHYVLIAYGLSLVALLAELVLLAGRRRQARHQLEDSGS